MCFFAVLPEDVIRRGQRAGSLSPHAFALQKAAAKKRAKPCRLINEEMDMSFFAICNSEVQRHCVIWPSLTSPRPAGFFFFFLFVRLHTA